MRVCGCVHVYEQYLKCSGHTLTLLDSSMISFYTFVQTYVKLQLSLAILFLCLVVVRAAYRK